MNEQEEENNITKLSIGGEQHPYNYQSKENNIHLIINCRHPPSFTPGRPNYHHHDRTSHRPLSPPPLERSHGTRILSITSSPRDPYLARTL